jgi:hypothetical protein
VQSDRGWSRAFADPIPLRDAGRFIAKLPKSEHDTPAWQGAMQALLLVAEDGDDTMLPRIGIMQALNRHRAKAAPEPRRKRAKA